MIMCVWAEYGWYAMHINANYVRLCVERLNRRKTSLAAHF